jgi:hypothetical protein
MGLRRSVEEEENDEHESCMRTSCGPEDHIYIYIHIYMQSNLSTRGHTPLLAWTDCQQSKAQACSSVYMSHGERQPLRQPLLFFVSAACISLCVARSAQH